MVSCYLCNELNVFGPTTRADVDTEERVQQRQAGCPGTGARGIPGKLKELGIDPGEENGYWDRIAV